MVQFRFAALDEADITKSSQADGRCSNGLTYKDAGVDIDAGNALVDAIKPLARSTVRPGADADLGGFGGLFDLKTAGYADPILVACNDGVGTKVLLANEVGKHDTIGIDLVAMCVNDLVVQGAEPLFFLDYFSTGRLDLDRAQAVLEGITAGCREAACALIGGETAEMPGLYGETEYDLAGFAVGAVERGRVLPQAVAAGDVVIGLPSSGFHSNGYSLIRKVMDLSDNRYDMPEPDGSGSTLGEALLAPTRIYVKACLALVKAGLAKGFAHITGGGLIENIPRALPVTLAVNIDTDHLPLPPLMAWLAEAGGLPSAEMVRTFNCGIGMVALVSSEHEDLAMTALADAGERPQRLGRVVEREGGGQVILDGLSQAWGLP